jgi:O-antigen/teichoic acid export membrane protein
METTHKHSLKRNTGWMFVGQGVGYALRAGYFILMARLLGVVQYGIVVGAFALVNLVANYSRLGSGTVMLRYVSADTKRFAAYWGHVLFVLMISGSLVVVLLKVIAPYALVRSSSQIVVVLAVGMCVFEQLAISSTQVFQAFQQMRITAFLNLLTSLVRFFAAGAMLMFLRHATAIQWAWASMIASSIAALIAFVFVTVRFGWPKFMPELIKIRGIEGIEYAFADSTTNAYDDLDKAMLGHYGMNAANGIYTMAYRIIEMATMPVVSLKMAAEPRLFELNENGTIHATDLGSRLLKRAVILGLIVSAVLFLFAPLVPFLVGKSFAEGVLALRWLCLIPVFRSVHYITGITLTGIGLQRYRTITQVVAVLMNIGLNLWLIPRFSWHGAAWSSLMTDASLGVMNWTVLRRAMRKAVSLSQGSPSLMLGTVEMADELVDIGIGEMKG